MPNAEPYFIHAEEDPLVLEMETTRQIIAANPGLSQRKLAERVAEALQVPFGTARHRVQAVITEG
jgi:hypothetical protein